MTIKGYACKEQGGQLESFEYKPEDLAADSSNKTSNYGTGFYLLLTR